MWTRAELKTSAKEVLKKFYWKAFLATLIVLAVSYAVSGAFSHFAVVIPTMQISIIVVTIFLIYPLTVGLYKLFLNLRSDLYNLNDLFFSFKEHYLKVVGSMAWMYLFTVLWTLLFIIPGIVKGIAYSMTPFILTDNPNIGYNRALKLSMAMTKGHKGDIFVLGLSFIGWYLLGILALCVGTLFVLPYVYATFAELYIKLRGIAIEKGLCTPEELNLQDY